MKWHNILSKSDIRKSDFDFTWSKIEVDDLDLKNVPKELENMDEGFNTVDVTAGDATIEGGMNLELRTWNLRFRTWNLGFRTWDLELRSKRR